MSHRVDIPAYFSRIGYDGPATPTLETLRAIHRLHPAAIAFENLTSFAGGPVSLELADVEHKLVHEQRGGYCFEQNLLFLEVLRELGFAVTGRSGRVLLGQPEDALTSRSHMLLQLELAGTTYITDVGFGGQVLTAPLRLEVDTPQPTPHESFRLVRPADGDYRLQSQLPDGWRTLYRFDLSPVFPIDYELGNYWVSTHPSSIFVTTLMVSRVLPERRLALRNRHFNVHHLGGKTEARELASLPELLALLEHDFAIQVPTTPELHAALARLF